MTTGRLETFADGVLAIAASLAPSTEEAIEIQLVLGALVCVQVWAKVRVQPMNRMQAVPDASSTCFILRKVLTSR